MTDRRVIACNYSSDTNVAKWGARAYLVLLNPGNGHERVEILARSRGGQWVRKWESLTRLTNFREVTLPPEHPRHGDERIWDAQPGDVDSLHEARGRSMDVSDPEGDA